jgi:hypothetical protein
MTGPTPYAELNVLLVELVDRARAILDDNFVGANLQGSFAVGDADVNSDCDFLVVTDRPLTAGQEAALRALHDEIPTRAGFWTQHLEGSYPVAGELRSLAGLGRTWLYVDHGWREMTWHTHCNSEVARWSLRERGVVLAGPDPKTLVDPVPPEALRARMRRDLPRLLDDLATWIDIELVAWGQRYAVTAICRQLYTLDTAEVASKRECLLWAIDRLGDEWEPLLRQVLADRALGWDPASAPRPGSVAATRALASHAVGLTGY